MYGLGILKGLGVTFKHFIATYTADVRYGLKRYTGDKFETRQGVDATGIYTVQYPEEKLAVPERFRFVPFLVVEDYDHPDRPGHDWCTACGICAKVCPPQCIWIVRAEDPVTKRPIAQPEAFFIDIDICMNCGYCAEFCPFDAIKMDHDYELASFDRTWTHIHDKERLSKQFSYWKTIAPTTAAEEAEARGGWEHIDVIKEKKKKAAAEAQAAETAAAAAEAAASAPAAQQDEAAAPAAEAAPAAAGTTDADAAREERRRKREAALARKHAKDQDEG